MDGLTFKVASKEEFKKSTEQNFIEWGGKLPFEVYYQRQSLQIPLYIKYNYRPFVIVDEKTTEVKASCEVVGNLCVYCVVTKGAIGEVDEGLNFGVASVFVAKENRGKGYAKLLLSQLYNQFKNEKMCKFSDLYSDIDPKFYTQFGWKNVLAPEATIDTETFVLDKIPDLQTIDIHESNLEEICSQDKEHMKIDILQKARDLSESKLIPCGDHVVIVSQVCTEEKMNFSMLRSSTYSNTFGYPKPTRFGVKIQTDTDFCFILWEHYFNKDLLKILRMRYPQGNMEIFQTLLHHAVLEARKFHFKSVLLWLSRDQFISNQSNHTTSTRQFEMEEKILDIKYRENSSIPMITYFGDDKGDIVWCNTEYFCWV